MSNKTSNKVIFPISMRECPCVSRVPQQDLDGPADRCDQTPRPLQPPNRDPRLLLLNPPHNVGPTLGCHWRVPLSHIPASVNMGPA
eukprot:2903259-Pyramimonas_sp.AAC.1